jgi:phage regulator Rha-like protein
MAYYDLSRLSGWADKQHRRFGDISEGIRGRLNEKLKAARIRKRLAALSATGGSIDSFEAAELLERSHATVLNTIDQMLTAQIPRQWCTPADRLRMRAFRLNRSGFMLLAMNLPGKRPLRDRLRIIELLNEMTDATDKP